MQVRTKAGPVMDAYEFTLMDIPPFVKEMPRNKGNYGVQSSVANPTQLTKVVEGQIILCPRDGSARRVITARQFHEQYEVVHDEPKPVVKKKRRGRAAGVTRPGVTSAEQPAEEPGIDIDAGTD